MKQKTYALLGHPVGHSVSPSIHQAAYDEFQLPHRYVVVDCPDRAAVEHQRDALVSGALDGANITVPHKRLALELADRLDDSAKQTGAANVWVRDSSGQIVAHNTDAPALAERLKLGRAGASGDASATEQKSAALVLGSGGAALAAVVACWRAGVDSVFVSARKWRGPRASWPSVTQFEQLGARSVEWSEAQSLEPAGPHTVADAAVRSAIIVQATSAGMSGLGNGEEVCLVLPWADISSGAFLYDVVYNPEVTPFLARARQSGRTSEGGLSMLVGQAALALELWLGLKPNRERLTEYARRALYGARA